MSGWTRLCFEYNPIAQSIVPLDTADIAKAQRRRKRVLSDEASLAEQVLFLQLHNRMLDIYDHEVCLPQLVII
jgi:hypothetical protein